ncbi:MAG: hypothetical protein ACHQUC_01035 [Chlamydiales bacterium]
MTLKEKKQFDKLLSLSSEQSVKSITIRIGENLYKRFNKHIKCLKNLSKQLTKQNWLEQAFKEKLTKQDDSIHDILSEKLLHIRIDDPLFKEIAKQVEMIKKFRNFSKKQWMLEAIYEKLDREEEQVKKDLEEKINSHTH